MNEWWRGCAICQIYPRSLQHTNGNGAVDDHNGHVLLPPVSRFVARVDAT